MKNESVPAFLKRSLDESPFLRFLVYVIVVNLVIATCGIGWLVHVFSR